jgi:osmotically-inducible protein OsmY
MPVIPRYWKCTCRLSVHETHGSLYSQCRCITRVKVIAQHGKVTLKGPVHNDDEKKTIESKAAQVAGDGNVNSEITVKGDSR